MKFQEGQFANKESEKKVEEALSFFQKHEKKSSFKKPKEKTEDNFSNQSEKVFSRPNRTKKFTSFDKVKERLAKTKVKEGPRTEKKDLSRKLSENPFLSGLASYLNPGRTSDLLSRKI